MIFKPSDELKALTWKQPYASLMLNQKIETRTWSTSYRGWVMMCAGISEYRHWDVVKISGIDNTERIVEWSQGKEEQMKNIKGFAFAIGRLVSIWKMKPEDERNTFVAYREDLFCHSYGYVQPIKPLSWRGSLGFSSVSEDFKKLIQVI